MNPMLLTYALFFVPLLLLLWEIRTFRQNKKNGNSTSIRPVQLIVMVVVMLLALFAIITGQTYDDILALFR